MASFGSAFTGEDDGTDSPMRNIVSSSAGALNKALFSDPQSRAALLQIGLNMMQPVGLGQTTGGHIASAIGGGGESVARTEKEDLEQEKFAQKQRTEDTELDIKRELAGYKGRETGAYERGVAAKNASDKAVLEQMKLQGRSDIQSDHDLWKAAQGLSADFVNRDQIQATYGSTDPIEIFKQMKAKQDQFRRIIGGPSGTAPTTAPAPGGGGSSQNQQALEWARKNPGDPRAKQILEKLGVK